MQPNQTALVGWGRVRLRAPARLGCAGRSSAAVGRQSAAGKCFGSQLRPSPANWGSFGGLELYSVAGARKMHANSTDLVSGARDGDRFCISTVNNARHALLATLDIRTDGYLGADR